MRWNVISNDLKFSGAAAHGTFFTLIHKMG